MAGKILKLSGSQKAAAFLTVLGKDSAVKVGEYFSKEELQQIVEAAEDLPTVNTNTVDYLVGEFDENYLSIGLLAGPDSLSSVLGASGSKAREVLKEKASESGGTGKGRDTSSLIENLDDEMIMGFFESEPPMIGAMLLEALGQDKAASMLAKLDDELRNEIFIAFMNRKELSPAMESMLGADLLELVQAVEVDTSALESAEKAANMINFLPEETSDSLVEYIKSQNPALATSISKALFRFPMLEFLDKPTRAKIMDGVEASDLSKALIGGSDGLKEAVLDVTSQRNRRMIESEIALGGTPEAIEAARKKVASYVLKLVKEGAIELPSPDELGNEE